MRQVEPLVLHHVDGSNEYGVSINVFREAATYVDKFGATLVFLEKDRFDIPVRYGQADLEHLDGKEPLRGRSFILADQRGCENS